MSQELSRNYSTIIVCPKSFISSSPTPELDRVSHLNSPPMYSSTPLYTVQYSQYVSTLELQPVVVRGPYNWFLCCQGCSYVGCCCCLLVVFIFPPSASRDRGCWRGGERKKMAKLTISGGPCPLAFFFFGGIKDDCPRRHRRYGNIDLQQLRAAWTASWK